VARKWPGVCFIGERGGEGEIAQIRGSKGARAILFTEVLQTYMHKRGSKKDVNRKGSLLHVSKEQPNTLEEPKGKKERATDGT